MHSEAYEIPPDTAARIQSARTAGRPVFAVGTTVVRALEDSARVLLKRVRPILLLTERPTRACLLFPGFPFRVVEGLLTNFHLPRSTLLALVAAFAGRDQVLAAYAMRSRPATASTVYGDCMLIR